MTLINENLCGDVETKGLNMDGDEEKDGDEG